MVPMEETSATADPEIPPKNIDAKTLTSARPPRTRPTKALENSTNRREIPPRPMISPARMKNGMASREKEFTPLTVLCRMDIMGILRNMAVNTEDMKSVNVMGNFNKRRITKEPINIAVAVLGSGMVATSYDTGLVLFFFCQALQIMYGDPEVIRSIQKDESCGDGKDYVVDGIRDSRCR